MIELCKTRCCPVFDPEKRVVVEDGVELDPKFVLTVWNSRDKSTKEIRINGILFNQEIIENLKKLV